MTQERHKNSRRWLQRSYYVLSPRLRFFFKSVTQTSYEILSDPNSREIYDREGVDGFAGPGGHSGGMSPDPADVFAQFFGGGATFFDFAGGPGSSRRKGEDTEIPYQVTLEDLYNGKSVKMNMEKEVICGTCNGLVYLKCMRSSLFMLRFQIRSQRECETQRVYTMRRQRMDLHADSNRSVQVWDDACQMFGMQRRRE